MMRDTARDTARVLILVLIICCSPVWVPVVLALKAIRWTTDRAYKILESLLGD